MWMSNYVCIYKIGVSLVVDEGLWLCSDTLIYVALLGLYNIIMLLECKINIVELFTLRCM